MKRPKLAKNQFICFSCSQVRERGVFVRIRCFNLRGCVVKTCRNLACRKSAAAGRSWRNPGGTGISNNLRRAKAIFNENRKPRSHLK